MTATDMTRHKKYPGFKGALETSPQPPDDGGMQAQIDRLDRVVERIDGDLTAMRVSLAGIDERMKHLPTKAQLLGWGLLGAAIVVGALWKIIAVLLEANNAALAAQLVKSIGH